MTWQEYNSMVADKTRMGVEVETVAQVIESYLRAFPDPQKREEICYQVSARTGIPMIDVYSNLSTVLGKMAKQKRIFSPVRGYWCLVRLNKS